MSIRVIAQTDPFDVKSRVIKEYSDCRTIKGVFRKLKIKTKTNPVTVSINGEAITDFTTKVYDGDLVLIKVLPTGENTARFVGAGMFLGGLALAFATGWTGVGLAAGVSMMFSGVTTFFAEDLYGAMFSSVGDEENASVTYTNPNYLESGTNSYGHNKEVPVIFGTYRVYPYQVAYPWMEYVVDNEGQDTQSVPSAVDASKLKKASDYIDDVKHVNAYERYEPLFEDTQDRIDEAIAGNATWDDIATLKTRARQIGRASTNRYFGYIEDNILEGVPDGEETPIYLGVAKPPSQKLHQVFLWGHKDIEINESTMKREDTLVVNAGNPTIAQQSLPYYGEEGVKQISVSQSMTAFDPEATTDEEGVPDGATPYTIILPQSITKITLNLALTAFVAQNSSGNLISTKTKVGYNIWEIPDDAEEYILVQTKQIQINSGDTSLATTQEMTAVTVDIENLDSEKSYQLVYWREYDDVTSKDCDLYTGASAYQTTITMTHVLCYTNKLTMTDNAKSLYKYADFLTEDDTIEGEVDNFNAVVQTKIPAYTGVGTGPSAWEDALTNNPASMYLYVLQGQPNKRPVSDDKIDWEKLEEWYVWCEQMEYECNACLTDPGAIDAILATIAFSGRATTNNGLLYSVIIDKPQTYPKQLITNVNSSNMSLTRTLNDDVHGVYVTFVNEDNDYIEEEVAVYAEGYDSTNATKLVSQTLTTVTKEQQVWELMKFMLNCYNRRTETLSVTMDIEYLLAQPGDLVHVSYDQLLLGLARGRVTEVVTNVSGETVSLVLDTDVTMEAGKNYVLVVRLADGTFETQASSTNIPLVTEEGTSDMVSLAVPQVTSIQVNDLISFGEAETVVGEYTVASITPSEDMSASLTLLNYTDDVYILGTMPTYESNVAKPSGNAVSPVLEKPYSLEDYVSKLTDVSQKVDASYDPSLKNSIRTSTPDASLLRSDCLQVALSSSALYFIDKDELSIYTTSFLPSSDRTLIADVQAQSLAVGESDTYVHFSNLEDSNKIYKVAIGSGEVTQVTTVSAIRPQVLDDYFLIYINYEDNNKLYKVNYLNTASAGTLLLDYSVGSYGIYGDTLIWSDVDTQQTYTKSLSNTDITSRGTLYYDEMLYDIVTTPATFWSYPDVSAVAVHIDIDTLESRTFEDTLFGDVVDHDCNNAGKYIMINSAGDAYITDLVPTTLQYTLDTETQTEALGITCNTQYLSNRLTNISVEDILSISKGDSISGQGIQEGSTVTFVGSTYVVISSVALEDGTDVEIEVLGTRLYLNANKVVVPNTISAGLLETDAINSIDRVADGLPNEGQQLYQHDLETGVEKQYDNTGKLIRQFTPDGGLWLAEGITIGGATVPSNPSFTDTVNTVYRQTSKPTGGTYVEGDTWFDTDDNLLYSYKDGDFQLVGPSSLGDLDNNANTKLNNIDEGATKNNIYTVATVENLPTNDLSTGDLGIVTDVDDLYKWSGTAWTKISDSTPGYLNNGGAVGYDGGSGTSWGIDSDGKLTASGASIQGDMEAISTDGLTRTIVDDGSITFYTREVNTDPWTEIGTMSGGYAVNGESALIVPQDFRIGDMTVGLGGGQINTNTAIGIDTLWRNTAGYNNVGVGRESLYFNLEGNRNVAIGPFTLRSNVNGGENVAIGNNALYNTREFFNIGIGSSALFTNNIGSENIGIGYKALYKTNSDNNVGVGRRSLYNNTEGSANTGLGDNALSNSTTGDNNIGIGYNAQASSPTVSGECVLGDSNITTLRCNTSTISSLSDKRDKTDIKPSSFGLEYLLQLKPVDFLWKTRDGNAKDGTREIGFIAQDLLALEEKYNAPQLKTVLQENPEKLEISMGRLLPPAIKAIQELNTKVEQQQTLLEQQQDIINKQQEAIDKLLAKLN